MDKKAFTLVEIIVCIAVMAVIGTASFFGVRLISNNIRINKLSQITDKVVSAAQVYLETNEESYNQLYKKQNGVMLPLMVLVNEGLLSLENTDLSEDDIKGEYVITALTNPEPKGAEGCVDISTVTSWDVLEPTPVYICTGGSGGSVGNGIFIGGSTSNFNYTKGVRNYITDYSINNVFYDGKAYKLLYIDRDDSLVLYTTEETFGDKFKGLTQETDSDQQVALSKTDKITNKVATIYKSCSGNKISTAVTLDNNLYNLYYTSEVHYYLSGLSLPMRYWTATGSDLIAHIRISVENKEQYVTLYDYKMLSAIQQPEFITYKDGTVSRFTGTHGRDEGTCSSLVFLTGKKIQLRSCMRITEGTGTEVNPYKISNMCS